MRKMILALVMVGMVFLTNETPKASYIGVPLGKSKAFEQLDVKSDRLKEIIILPEGNFNKEEAADIIHRMDRLPSSMLDKISRKGIKIVLFNGRLTDQPGASHLKGKVPRGYPETETWDNVPGIGGSETVLVKIGASEKGKGHGSVNLEYHELAHSLQHQVYHSVKLDHEITESWVQEKAALFPGQPYFLNYPEEYFAECFAFYFSSKKTRDELKMKAPKMYNLLSSLQ